jgi:mannose-6-phosphate isomerase-like protein (cupin superfamily)
MTYVGDAGQISARFRPMVEVPPLVRPTSSVRFVAPGSVTDGQFGLFEWHMKPMAGGPEPHFHKTFSESFYVISGRVGLYDGSRWIDATSGDFIYVPMGGIHAFRNESAAAATMLIVFAPGAARERFFEELAEIANSGRILTPEEWTELYARHDQYMV